METYPPLVTPLRRVLVWLVAVFGLLGGGLWVLRLAAQERPEVTAFSPGAGAMAIPVQMPIRITFSENMNPNSAAAALRLEPELAGNITWEANTLVFTPVEPWPAGGVITVELGQQARSRVGLRLREPLSWQFSVARTLLAYLWPTYPGPGQVTGLYALDPVGGQTTQLLSPPLGVLDYTFSADGRTIYYTTPDPEGGTSIYAHHRLDGTETEIVHCLLEICQRPVPAPDGAWVVYENATTLEVWLARPGAAPERLFSNARQPALASTGWLAVYSDAQLGYILQNMDSGERLFFSNQTGEPGAWSPDGNLFVAAEITTLAASRLAQFDLTKNPPTAAYLVPDNNRQYLYPVYAPDGQRIAFAHKYLDDRWSRGGQLWVVDANGSNPRPLTDDPIYHHTAFAWSLDSQTLAYVRFNESTLSEPPEVWIIPAEPPAAGELLTGTLLVINAHAPQWVP